MSMTVYCLFEIEVPFEWVDFCFSEVWCDSSPGQRGPVVQRTGLSLQWSWSQSKQLRLLFLWYKILYSEWTYCIYVWYGRPSVEFILKCISNNSLFWYVRDNYFVSIAKGRLFNYIFCTDTFASSCGARILAVDRRKLLWLCQCNTAEMTTADE